MRKPESNLIACGELVSARTLQAAFSLLLLSLASLMLLRLLLGA